MARPKRRGRYCRICARYRSNEAFSGKGYRRCVCKRCSRLPKAQIEAIDRWDEIDGFLYQSNISERNIGRLRELADHSDELVADAAKVVLAIALIHPGKRSRMRHLQGNYPELFQKLEALGMVPDYYLESTEYLTRAFADEEFDLDGDVAEEYDWTANVQFSELNDLPFETYPHFGARCAPYRDE
jgi:hypothetical protein